MVPSSSANQQREMTSLLAEIAVLLTQELTLIARRDWDELPALKKRKTLLAYRLKKLERTAISTNSLPTSLLRLKSRVAALENKSRRKIAAQIQLISNQVVALQDLHLFWRECLSISFGNLRNPISSP